ncbi:MAG: metallophosphoesterase [Bacteroidetes bacterium]|nr:metallophosphoesterase [Bacteroidota bacterium]
MILFVTIAVTIYTLINYLIFIRALQAFPAGSSLRIWFIMAFWLIAASFVAARILERTNPCHFTEFLTWTGNFWLAFMLFFTLIVILLDITRLFNHFFHFLPAFIYSDYLRTKQIILIVSVAYTVIMVTAGYINARNPRVRELSLAVAKSGHGRKSLTISMASDIHLGTIIRKAKAKELVRLLNAPKPDLILLAGDVVDEDLAPVIKDNIGEALCELKAGIGVYAITGNHEYIGGAGPAVEYLEKHCVKMLRDTALLVNGQFYIVGRDDRDKPRFTGKARKELSDIMKDVDHSYPIILMDHQPFNLAKAVENGVDLQLSGHTHHGQIWPFNYITEAIYELSWGYKKIKKTHFYVSCGFGTWGPPVRLGNRPEVLIIHLTFNNE